MESKDVLSRMDDSRIKLEEPDRLKGRFMGELQGLEESLIEEAHKILEQKITVVKEIVKKEIEAAVLKYKEDLSAIEEMKRNDPADKDAIGVTERMAWQNLNDKVNVIKEKMRKNLLS